MKIVANLRASFATGQSLPYEFRKQALDRLSKALHQHEGELLAALKADLGKSPAEAYTSEIAIIHHELKYTLKNLWKWMRPRRTPTPMHLQPACSRIYCEPLGVVLIIGPWNYPVQLALVPLIGALAAGNLAVVKPSEIAANSSAALRKLLEATFPADQVAVVEGGIGPTTELLNQKFDHIFFTGSTPVGKIVYEAAAKNLTPVTLELGGKSPTIVAEDADLELAARRIVWGKFLNAGQTCVAPDYVYAHERVLQPLVSAMEKYIHHQFGQEIQSSPDYGRIVNTRNFARLSHLMETGRILYGGQRDEKSLYIAPTLIGDVGWKDPVMHEEIFGPLLPVLPYRDFASAVAEIKKHDKPLSAYLFTNDGDIKEKFIKELSFGGGCLNDVVVHLANGHLPFGGVGASGIGSYHGEKSFLTFSHQKSVLHKSRFFDVPLRYPPFSDRKIKWLRSLFGLSAKMD